MVRVGEYFDSDVLIRQKQFDKVGMQNVTHKV